MGRLAHRAGHLPSLTKNSYMGTAGYNTLKGRQGWRSAQCEDNGINNLAVGLCKHNGALLGSGTPVYRRVISDKEQGVSFYILNNLNYSGSISGLTMDMRRETSAFSFTHDTAISCIYTLGAGEGTTSGIKTSFYSATTIESGVQLTKFLSFVSLVGCGFMSLTIDSGVTFTSAAHKISVLTLRSKLGDTITNLPERAAFIGILHDTSQGTQLLQNLLLMPAPATNSMFFQLGGTTVATHAIRFVDDNAETYYLLVHKPS